MTCEFLNHKAFLVFFFNCTLHYRAPLAKQYLTFGHSVVSILPVGSKYDSQGVWVGQKCSIFQKLTCDNLHCAKVAKIHVCGKKWLESRDKK